MLTRGLGLSLSLFGEPCVFNVSKLHFRKGLDSSFNFVIMMDHPLPLEGNSMAKKGILVSLETELVFFIKFRSADVIQSPASMLSDQVVNNPGNGLVVVNSGMIEPWNLF